MSSRIKPQNCIFQNVCAVQSSRLSTLHNSGSWPRTVPWTSIPENLTRLRPILYGRWKMHCALTCNCVFTPYRAIVFKNSQHFDFFAGFCGCLLAIDWFTTTAPFLYLAINFLLVTNSVRGKRKAELLPVIINEVWTHNLKRQSKPGVGCRSVTKVTPELSKLSCCGWGSCTISRYGAGCFSSCRG